MTDFLDRLETDLVAAARRRATGSPVRTSRATPARRSLILALAALVVVGAASAGATLYVLRGSPIPAPRAVSPQQTPNPATNHVVGFTVRDPDRSAPPWTLRLARSRTGLLCSTVGQVLDGTFGLVGLDRRFRAIAPGVADSCGTRRTNAATLVGARVFAPGPRLGLRTIVSGVAGPKLRAVTITTHGRGAAVPVHPDGVFLAVERGLPEDLGLKVSLRFADGHVESHPFGVVPLVAVDPAGGHAWRLTPIAFGAPMGKSRDSTTCLRFSSLHPTTRSPVSPAACGRLGDDARHPTGWFFALRRIVPGTSGSTKDTVSADGDWGHSPPRTAVWGEYGTNVASISITGPPGAVMTRSAPIAGLGTFLALFGPNVRADQVTVTVRLTSGRVLTRHASSNLRAFPRPG